MLRLSCPFLSHSRSLFFHSFLSRLFFICQQILSPPILSFLSFIIISVYKSTTNFHCITMPSRSCRTRAPTNITSYQSPTTQMKMCATAPRRSQVACYFPHLSVHCRSQETPPKQSAPLFLPRLQGLPIAKKIGP